MFKTLLFPKKLLLKLYIFREKGNREIEKQ